MANPDQPDDDFLEVMCIVSLEKSSVILVETINKEPMPGQEDDDSK